MSDISQGPGWWQAADGKWYAPELHPNYQPPAAAPQPAAAPPAAPQPAAASRRPPHHHRARWPPPPQMGAPAPAAGVGYAPTAAPVGLGYNPPPAKKSGVSGCLVAFLVVFVLSIVAGILIVFFVGPQAPATPSDNAVGVDNCPFLTAKEAEAALGGTQIGATKAAWPPGSSRDRQPGAAQRPVLHGHRHVGQPQRDRPGGQVRRGRCGHACSRTS